MNTELCDVVLRTGEVTSPGTIVRSSERGALVETPSVIEGDLFSVSFRESSYGYLGLEGTGRKVGVPGAKENQLGVKWHYITSRVGLAAIKELFIEEFSAEFPGLDDERVARIGGYWTVNMEPEVPEYAAPLPSLISVETYEGAVDALSRENGTLYPKCSVTYSIGMIAHKGRALRLTTGSMVIHTNGVLPPLGALVSLQFRVSHLPREPVVVIRGMVKNRAAKGTRKGHMSTFEVKIRDLYDMDAPGALLSFLEQLSVKD